MFTLHKVMITIIKLKMHLYSSCTTYEGCGNSMCLDQQAQGLKVRGKELAPRRSQRELQSLLTVEWSDLESKGSLAGEGRGRLQPQNVNPWPPFSQQSQDRVTGWPTQLLLAPVYSEREPGRVAASLEKCHKRGLSLPSGSSAGLSTLIPIYQDMEAQGQDVTCSKSHRDCYH